MNDGHPADGKEKRFSSLLKLFGRGKRDEDVTEEIMDMVNESHEQGVIAENEAEMIGNIFEFAEKQAEDVMTHRKNIVALDAALTAKGEAVDFAINVEVPDENIINRMSGRRACVGCGATYHIKYNPTKVEGICDVCGEKLILRDDDKPETVKNRLSVYHEQTQPLIDFYAKKNVLAEVDGTKDMEEVFEDIVKILGK